MASPRVLHRLHVLNASVDGDCIRTRDKQVSKTGRDGFDLMAAEEEGRGLEDRTTHFWESHAELVHGRGNSFAGTTPALMHPAVWTRHLTDLELHGGLQLQQFASKSVSSKIDCMADSFMR